MGTSEAAVCGTHPALSSRNGERVSAPRGESGKVKIRVLVLEMAHEDWDPGLRTGVGDRACRPCSPRGVRTEPPEF